MARERAAGDRPPRPAKLSKTPSHRTLAARNRAIREWLGPTTGTGPGLYCLSFDVEFPTAAWWYIAPVYPFTATMLQKYLRNLAVKFPLIPVPNPPQSTARTPNPSTVLQPTRGLGGGQAKAQDTQQRPTGEGAGQQRCLARTVLCHTLSGNPVDLLTITNFDAPLPVVQQREYVLVTSRVHPGETPASWVLKGLLDFLLSSSPRA